VPYGALVGGREPLAGIRDRRLSEQELLSRGVAAVEVLGRDDPLWPGQAATLLALLLYLALPTPLTLGPGWPLPVAESVLLAGLVIAARGGRRARGRRAIAIGLVIVAALASLSSLAMLTHYLLAGGHARGTDLLDGGVIIWSTNLLLFAVLYWELDRGGPRRTGGSSAPVAPDLLFPQMTYDDYSTSGWSASFGDYLYVSLTNQTAFSPTDAMPLTPRVKALMGLQGVAALITTGVVVARAVNILG
jgi:hypothetical protein